MSAPELTAAADAAPEAATASLPPPVDTAENAAENTVDTVENAVDATGNPMSSLVTGAPEPEPEPEPEPAMRPENYHVLSDSTGFVGAFYTAAAAEAEAMKYSLVPFIVQRFEVAPGPVGTIWVVLYRDIDAVAFVSNSRAEAERVQKMYGRVGLTYIDSIDYWEHPANTVARAAAQRLEVISRAHVMYAGPATLEELQAREMEDYDRLSRLMQPSENSPITRILRENEPITFLDCVVPVSVGCPTPACDQFVGELADEPVATRAEAPIVTDQ